MPTIFRYKGYKFHFFSNEGMPPEPPHIHVRHGERVAKFWLVPEVALADAWGMAASELNELRKVVEEHRDEFERAWHERFP
jgi:hypothetical protein